MAEQGGSVPNLLDGFIVPESDPQKFKLPGEHIYEGDVYTAHHPAASIDRVRRFQFYEDDVLVATYPRSGTTWMQELVYLVMTDGDVDGASTMPIRDRGPYLEFHTTDLDKLEHMARPRQMKTHLQYGLLAATLERTSPRIIVVTRNLQDVLVSCYHIYKDLLKFPGTWNDFFEFQVKAKRLIYGEWFDFTVGWWQHQGKPNILFVTYEEMQKDIRSVIEKICKFLDKKLLPDVVEKIIKHTSFDEMKKRGEALAKKNDRFKLNNMVYPLMRKGVVGDSKKYFTPEQTEYCDRILRKKLAGTALSYSMMTILIH